MSVTQFDGINFAYSGGTWTEPLLTERLQYAWSLGFRFLRIVGAVYTGTGTINQIKAICEAALNMGFKVMNGTTVNGAPNLTATTLPQYESVVMGLAIHFNTHPHGENFYLWLQNEDDDRVDGTTLTKTTFQNRMGTLSQQIHALPGNKVKTGVCVTTNNTTAYKNNPGDFDFLGLNAYSGRHTFHSQVLGWMRALGRKGWVTEWNSSNNGASDFATPIEHENECVSRLKRMNDLRAMNFFFSLDASSGTPQQWGLLLNNGTIRRAINMFLKPRYAVDTWMYPTKAGE